MKKILLTCIIFAITTPSFANQMQADEMARLVSYSHAIGTISKETFESLENSPSFYAQWNTITPQKINCIKNNLSDDSYKSMIQPDVNTFVSQHTLQQNYSFIKLLKSGLADGFRNLVLFGSRTRRDVLNGKITEIELQEILRKNTVVSPQQRVALTTFYNDSYYKDLKSFMLTDISLSSGISNARAYKLGEKIGSDKVMNFHNYVSNFCSLN